MKVLIAGGSGFIGKSLSKLLIEKGYEVSILTRNPKPSSSSLVKEFSWNVANSSIDITAFDEVDALINLAGENIGAKRWSGAQKQIIEQSRLASAQLLFNTVSQLTHKPKIYISASAIGIYGYDRGERLMVESDLCGTDFLAQVCQKWELEALRFQELGLRTCCVRTGIVLSEFDGALKQVMASLKFHLLFRLGSGKQPFPWIGIHDVCNIYLHLLNNNNSEGAYNAVAPSQDTFADLLIAISANAPAITFTLPVPAYVLKLALGEMATILLNGSNITPQKILSEGFIFKFSSLPNLLKANS